MGAENKTYLIKGTETKNKQSKKKDLNLEKTELEDNLREALQGREASSSGLSPSQGPAPSHSSSGGRDPTVNYFRGCFITDLAAVRILMSIPLFRRPTG